MRAMATVTTRNQTYINSAVRELHVRTLKATASVPAVGTAAIAMIAQEISPDWALRSRYQKTRLRTNTDDSETRGINRPLKSQNVAMANKKK
jgi:hypothetical protein